MAATSPFGLRCVRGVGDAAPGGGHQLLELGRTLVHVLDLELELGLLARLNVGDVDERDVIPRISARSPAR